MQLCKKDSDLDWKDSVYFLRDRSKFLKKKKIAFQDKSDKRNYSALRHLREIFHLKPKKSRLETKKERVTIIGVDIVRFEYFELGFHNVITSSSDGKDIEQYLNICKVYESEKVP